MKPLLAHQFAVVTGHEENCRFVAFPVERVRELRAAVNLCRFESKKRIDIAR
jgi:hypothetical protein